MQAATRKSAGHLPLQLEAEPGSPGAAPPQTPHRPGFGPAARGPFSGATPSRFVNAAELGNTLTMYTEMPQDEVALDEFYDYCMRRQRLLQEIDNAGVRHPPQSSGFKSCIRAALTAARFNITPLNTSSVLRNDDTLMEAIRADRISHWGLRLGYVTNDEKLTWLLEKEALLFNFRFEELPDKMAFLRDNEFNFEVVSKAERQLLASHLAAYSVKEETPVFKVPFERVPGLVGSRMVAVQAGIAFVPINMIGDLAGFEFRQRLRASLLAVRLALPSMEDDVRAVAIVRQIVDGATAASDAAANWSADMLIRANQVDSLANHFPPCMREMHRHLNTVHHMKHTGRRQFGLFLKGLGVPMEESLAYWKRAFGPKIAPDAFDRNYAYNIRYDYGREGSRTQARPFGCRSIILGDPPARGSGPHAIEQHGCPLRQSKEPELRRLAQSYHLRDAEMPSLLAEVQGSHYQFACGRLLRSMRQSRAQATKAPGTEAPPPVDDDIRPISHPNEFASISMGINRSSGAARFFASARFREGAVGADGAARQDDAGAHSKRHQTESAAPPAAASNVSMADLADLDL
ncbi:hypothetical protein H696_01802 [Fonticula alba]|uniref:DNA primase large subunit C-terminal domain-containing protein n=1 Tax=Fonticula alba TaxID=691883 RepID=A0A058ZEN1_FONAL|nr:hypothetical protein H696_01802 [Fonticula alba]KCV72406.1 hypothetical protein H696_01802 [Fonticula alba]|eukprot:XP_009493984.1 hypothetical protein H696_01802 [Fonticula alba]